MFIIQSASTIQKKLIKSSAVNYFEIFFFQVKLRIFAFRHLPVVQLVTSVIAEGEALDLDVVGRLLQGQRRPGKAVDIRDGSTPQQFLRFRRILS